MRVRRGLGASRTRDLALAVAVLVNGLALWMLSRTGFAPPIPWRDEGSLQVELMRPFPAPRPESRAPARRAEAPASMAPSAPRPLADAPGLPVSPPATGEASAAAVSAALLSAMLRRGHVGCANPDAAGLTPAERDACLRRLGEGAATAARLPAVPAEKRDYYAAVAASKAAMFADPLGGHVARVVCGPGHGGKHGRVPCDFIMPLSPMTPEADVPAP